MKYGNGVLFTSFETIESVLQIVLKNARQVLGVGVCCSVKVYKYDDELKCGIAIWRTPPGNNAEYDFTT